MANLPYLAGKLIGLAMMVEIGVADNEAVGAALRGVAEELLEDE